VIEFETPRREMPTLNLSALIDITFILVIFIVLAATFSRVRVIDVALPSAQATNAAEEEALVVTIPVEGPVRFGELEVPFAHVRQALAEHRERHRSLLLVADRQAAIERAVAVMGDAAQLGYGSVAIATESRPASAGGATP